MTNKLTVLFLALALSSSVLAQTGTTTATAVKPKPLTENQQNSVLKARLASAEARRNYAEAVAQVQGALEKMRESVKNTEEAEQQAVAKVKTETSAPANCGITDKLEWTCAAPAPIPAANGAKPAPTVPAAKEPKQ